MDNDKVTITEAANKLGITRQYVHYMIDKCEIIPERVDAPMGRNDHYLLISQSDVDVIRQKLDTGLRRPSRRVGAKNV